MPDFREDEIFPAAMNGPNAQKLQGYFADNMDSYATSTDALEQLGNIRTAMGDNLRRIGKNLGYSSSETDDEAYRYSLLNFIISKKTNGSMDFIYQYFQRLESVNYRYIDIWPLIEHNNDNVGLMTSDGVGLTFENGVGVLFESPDLGIKFLEERADFHLNTAVRQWNPVYETLIQGVRMVGRRIIATEVIEVDYVLPSTMMEKDPRAEVLQRVEIYNGNTLIASSSTVETLTRQDGMSFQSFDISNAPTATQFNRIAFYIDNTFIHEQLYPAPFVFSMSRKEIRFNFDGATPSVGLVFDNGEGAPVGIMFDTEVGAIVQYPITP